MNTELAKRIPFQFFSHLNCDHEHIILQRNEVLNITREIITRYRVNSWKPSKQIHCFYINTKGSKPYPSLSKLLDDNPELALLAHQHYPEPAMAA